MACVDIKCLLAPVKSCILESVAHFSDPQAEILGVQRTQHIGSSLRKPEGRIILGRIEDGSEAGLLESLTLSSLMSTDPGFRLLLAVHSRCRLVGLCSLNLLLMFCVHHAIEILVGFLLKELPILVDIG